MHKFYTVLVRERVEKTAAAPYEAAVLVDNRRSYKRPPFAARGGPGPIDLQAGHIVWVGQLTEPGLMARPVLVVAVGRPVARTTGEQQHGCAQNKRKERRPWHHHFASNTYTHTTRG